MADIGNTNAEATSNSAGADGLQVSGPYTASLTGVISSVSGYFGTTTGTGSIPFRLVVYEDAAGAPGALIASSTPGSVAHDTAFAWVTLAATGNIVNGTAYWIGVHQDAPGGTANLEYKYNGSSPDKHIDYVTATYASGAPASFPGSPGQVNWDGSFYLTAAAPVAPKGDGGAAAMMLLLLR